MVTPYPVSVADPDLQIRVRGGGSHPDPEVRFGGGGGCGGLTKLFLAFGPQLGLKMGGGSTPGSATMFVQIHIIIKIFLSSL